MDVQPARSRGWVMSTMTMADMVNMPAAPIPCTTRSPINASMGTPADAPVAPTKKSTRPTKYITFLPRA